MILQGEAYNKWCSGGAGRGALYCWIEPTWVRIQLERVGTGLQTV